jgi:hypothetical protein
MSIRGFLRIPLQLQALCLDQEQSVVRAMADYRQLPGHTRTGARHERTPNLSEHILTPPFTKDFPLQPGIHLHWLLPDALTQGEQDEAGTRFPYVPNRWLILRSGGGKPERQWVVESDFVYPEGAEDDFTHEGRTPTNVAVIPDPAPAMGQRYRFVGRGLPLDQWRTEQGKPGNTHLEALTSIGPEREVAILDSVRATFASFYPNCRTVFGFLDEDFQVRTPPAGLRYDVVGWYGHSERDCLAPWLAEADSVEHLKRLLEEQLEWTLDPEAPLPKAALLHARLTFAPGARAARDIVRELPKPKLAVGRTETESLAAHLAHVYAPDTSEEHRARRRLIEEQLEALQLTERLEGHVLDLDDILREARHERGFGAIPGGIRWAIQPRTDTTKDVFSLSRGARKRALRSPRPEWVGMLEVLNSLQEEYQRGVAVLEDLKQRMYMRWVALLPDKKLTVEYFEDYVVPVRRQRTALGKARLEENEATGEYRMVAEPEAFEVASSLSTHYDWYVRVINTYSKFVLGNPNHESYESWGVEFPNCCGFELSEEHTVTVLERDKAWEIKDRGIVYPVRAGQTGLFLEIPPAATSVAVRLAGALTQLQDTIAAHNATEAGAEAPFDLRAQPDLPYWEPADPVVLFSGDAASGDIWKGTGPDEDFLACGFADVTLDLETLPTGSITALTTYLSGLGTDVGRKWTEPPWNPFLMHWNLHIAPVGRTDNGDFPPELLLNHYALERQDVDLVLKDGEEAKFAETADTYSGISLLSPSAGLELRERVLFWLETALLPRYYEAQDIPLDEQVEGYLRAHFDEVKAWYRQAHPDATIEDPVFTSLWAYDEVMKTPCLAQTLGNFSQILMLREPTMQLRISDPTAYTNSIQFFITETVRDAMGGEMQRRPLTLDRFNPLRAGAMNLTGLWLVDSFGQVKEVIQGQEHVDVVTPDDQTPSLDKYDVLLSPRLAQPMRLRFEWIPSEPSGGRRTNELPETNPVCGFLLVNNLDGALAVYDKDGRALGSVDRGNQWRTAPETGLNIRVDRSGQPELPNAHLQQVVRYVMAQEADFPSRFLSTVRTALDTIDPEAYAENPSRALLVARPVAVVRASLKLERLGPPAFDPSALAAGTVTSRHIEKLQVPIRLGEHQQLDDGVVGYWIEDTDGAFEDDILYSPQLRGINHPKIRTYADGSLNIVRDSESPSLFVTMLLDPRGQVHASTGLLPSPQLRVHPDHYGRALSEMEVSFLTGPFLSDKGALRLPVPEEAGHVWTWVTQQPGGAWARTDALAAPNPRAAFSAPQELREGWLILRKGPTE